MSHAPQTPSRLGGRAIVSVDTANRLRRLVEEVGIPRAREMLGEGIGRTAIASALAMLPMNAASAALLAIRVRELASAGAPEAA